MEPSEPLTRHDQGGFPRGGAEALLQRIMEGDVDSLDGAGTHAHRRGRTTGRNGWRQGARDTRPGTSNLRVPGLRQGSHFPGSLAACKTPERAPEAGIREALARGRT